MLFCFQILPSANREKRFLVTKGVFFYFTSFELSVQFWRWLIAIGVR